jgi:signal transduction histidine kinase
MGPVTANSERSPLTEIRNLHEKIRSVEYLQELMDSLPNPGMIITPQRQIVLFNEEFTKLIGARKIEDTLGMRPGDILKCVYAVDDPEGCSTAPECQFCNALFTILESQQQNEKVSKEARLITKDEGRITNFDLVITSSPIMIEGQQFYLVTMMDITSEKRRKVMERVFFHDVLNLAHGLENTLHVSQMNECSPVGGRTLDNSRKITTSLIDEILFQKNLLSAESGDLRIQVSSFRSIDLLKEIIDHMGDSKESVGKYLVILGSSEDIEIRTDRSLLRRVLMNMTKNGLEASESGEEVKLSCYREKNEIVFSVWNSAVMSEEVISQLWQRSFSTKGENRGIGTYSMRLFTEDYLGGWIDFTSDKVEGTEFRVHLPLHS